MRRLNPSKLTFEERLEGFRGNLIVSAVATRQGPERDGIQERIRLIEPAKEMHAWLMSHDLRPPK
jgi:hypothetical protein